jgi:outer membrane protein OmpA-like peptidoglycan-associated protein
MATTVHDDYLPCGDYKANIGNASANHKNFITFQKNDDHYFAWVDGDKIVMRSEAYPDAEKMERGIAAIHKNWDIAERYAVITEDGKQLLVLYGGGDHQKHTGNFENHSEIGRSCPKETREELNELLQCKGTDFANKVVPITTAKAATAEVAAAKPAMTAAAAATVVTAAAATNQATAKTTEAAKTATSYAANTPPAVEGGSGMGWLKWLLPLLLLLGAFLWWKSCNSSKTEGDVAATTDANGTIVANDTNNNANVANTANTAVMTPAKITIDSVSGVVSYDLGAVGDVDICEGQKLIGVAKNGFENTLLDFLKNGSIDTVDKTKNWFTMHDVQFITGKTEYANPKAIQQIKNVAAILKCNPNMVLKIGGYTDVRGDDKSNQALSDRRAKQVSKDLKANGVAASQIKEAVGYGEEFATGTEGDVEAMARDRKTAAKVAVK